MHEPPRLFPLDGDGQTLEDAALAVLAAGDEARCLVCDGALQLVMGGVECEDCGTALLLGEETTESHALWVG